MPKHSFFTMRHFFAPKTVSLLGNAGQDNPMRTEYLDSE
jgi:hypothetical protein